jgi:glycogen debranching enzyme
MPPNQINNTIDQAFEISKRVLRDAYSENGINAGQTHFSDVWIRDSSFAGWGALSIGDASIVQNFLLHTLDNIKEDGQCPLRIGQKYFLLKYIGLRGPQGPTYIEDKYISIPMDSNALIVILFNKFLIHTNNTEITTQYYAKLKHVIKWYERTTDNNLVTEGPYAGWADSVKKSGKVLYTNALYYKALVSFVNIAKTLNITSDTQTFKSLSEKVKHELINTFWNGNYLIDWVNKKKEKTTFSVEANMLAILFEIPNNDQTKKIIDFMFENKVITEFGCPVVYDKYNWNDVYTPFLFIGLEDYHNGLIWFWVSCIASIALKKSGYSEEAVSLLGKISNKITRDNSIYEVYTKNGEPVKRLFYKSEEGFAWSAGLFVWAYQELFNTPK